MCWSNTATFKTFFSPGSFLDQQSWAASKAAFAKTEAFVTVVFLLPLSLAGNKSDSEELSAFLNPFLGIYELQWPGSEWFIIMNKLMNNSEALMEVTLSNFHSHLMD